MALVWCYQFLKIIQGLDVHQRIFRAIDLQPIRDETSAARTHHALRQTECMRKATDTTETTQLACHAGGEEHGAPRGEKSALRGNGKNYLSTDSKHSSLKTLQTSKS